MKKLTFMLSALCLLVIVACSKDTEINEPTSVNPNFKVTEYNAKSGDSRLGGTDTRTYDTATLCYTVDLVAGQNTIVGTVSAYKTSTEMYISYEITEPGWTIKTTHLSAGNCVETIPTTGSGNPKVGQFEKSTDHTIIIQEVTEVVYEFTKDVVFAGLDPNDLDPDLSNYCFAAHAVVEGISNETAWAGSLEPDAIGDSVKSFDGNNWAMLIRAEYGDTCTSNGGDTE